MEQKSKVTFDLGRLQTKIKLQPKLLAERPYLAQKYMHYLKVAGDNKSIDQEEVETMIEYMSNYRDFKQIEEEKNEKLMAVDEKKLVESLMEKGEGLAEPVSSIPIADETGWDDDLQFDLDNDDHFGIDEQQNQIRAATEKVWLSTERQEYADYLQTFVSDTMQTEIAAAYTSDPT